MDNNYTYRAPRIVLVCGARDATHTYWSDHGWTHNASQAKSMTDQESIQPYLNAIKEGRRVWEQPDWMSRYDWQKQSWFIPSTNGKF